MPNVEIVVEASLGDSLVKLNLAEHAVKDLGDSGESASHKLRDFNSVMDDATSASHKVGAAMVDTERLIRDAEEAITGGAAGGSGGGGLTNAVSNMALNFYSAVPALSAFMNPLVLIPALVLGASVAIVALADAVGTLIAIISAFVAPVTLIIGLLGLLGGAFFLAAQKAFGMHEDGFGQAIAGLKKQFDDLTTTLVGRFMPVFQFLIHNASQALDFFNKIAKLPLDDAFKKLAQQGIPAVTHFLEKIGSMLAHPIRLAFQIAFGTGKAGNEAQSAVAALWKQFTDFLFGYTQTHKIHIGRALIVTHSEVQGIFQPLIDWFNRHDFTAQGIKIGHQLLNGLKPFAKPAERFIVTVFEDAFKTVIRNFASTIGRLVVEWSPFGAAGKRAAKEINDALTRELEQALDAIVSKAEAAWSKIESLARGHLDAIKSAILVLAGIFAGPLVGAVEQVVGAINGIIGALNTAVGIAQALASAISAASLGSSSSTAGRTGMGGNSPGKPGKPVGHIAVAHFHYHATGSSSESASFRRFVREVSREIGRQNHILAGGQ